MPDGSINVKITAEAGGFTSTVNQAKASLDQLAAAIHAQTAGLGQTTSAMQQLATAVQAQNAGLAQTISALQQSTAAHNAHAAAVHQGAAAHSGLAQQIHQANQTLTGMLSPITSVTGGLKEMGEVLLAAFAVEKIVETVKAMGELGEQTENTAAAIGISAQKFSLLSATLELVDGRSETSARALIILQSKLVEAVENPASKAREALLAMGISLDQMKAGLTDIPGFLALTADGFVRMGEGAARTAAFRD